MADQDRISRREAGVLIAAAEASVGYALAFAESTDPDHAAAWYRRGRDHALAWFHRDPRYDASLLASVQDLDGYLSASDVTAVPAAFWAANGWAGWVNLNRSRPAALIDIPVIIALAEFVVDRDEGYEYGSAHLVLGSLAGAVPAALGGDRERASAHFERALSLADRRFLMTQVLYAESVAVQTQNRELFVALLSEVTAAPPDLLPDRLLPNAVARQRAERLLADVDVLFL